METSEARMKVRWKEYLEHLYYDKTDDEEDKESQLEENMLEVMMSEMKNALRCIQKRKTIRTDEILVELIMSSGKKIIKKLRELFNQILKNRTVPMDFKKSRLVMIPKKSNADKCENY